jgi:hypothetical protein
MGRCPSLRAAVLSLLRAPEDAVLVTGSLFTVGDAKRALQR